MADPGLIEELRAIARYEQISLGEVIRQGLEWRASTRRRVPSFVKRRMPRDMGADDAAARDEEIILEWVKDRDARRRNAGV